MMTHRPYDPPLPVPDPEHVLLRIEEQDFHRLPERVQYLMGLYRTGEWVRGSVHYVELNACRVPELEAEMRKHLPEPHSR